MIILPESLKHNVLASQIKGGLEVSMMLGVHDVHDVSIEQAQTSTYHPQGNGP